MGINYKDLAFWTQENLIKNRFQCTTVLHLAIKKSFKKLKSKTTIQKRSKPKIQNN